MRRRRILQALSAAPVLPSLWSAENTRVWLGAEYWANPLQDWRKRGAGFECFVSGGDRNVYWLTKEIVPGDFTMRVVVNRLDGGAWSEGWLGFRIGMRGHFNDYRDTAVRGLGLEIGMRQDGTLFIGPGSDGTKAPLQFPMTLELRSRGGMLTLSANGQSIEAPGPEEYTRGGVALVCHAGPQEAKFPVWVEPEGVNAGKPNQNRGGNFTASFSGWTLEGPAVKEVPERAWGPVLFAQHTLSGGVLKLTAQLAPLEGDEGVASLWIDGKAAADARPDVFSSTASFRVALEAARDHTYEVRFQGSSYKGEIRRDPVEAAQVKVGSLTCQGDFGFPHEDIARNLRVLRPDLLLFTGDQLYEANGGYGVQRGPLAAARLDYLRKWYLYGWAWGEFTRNTPTVCLPDDHDVYHGNLWGASGRRAEGQGAPDYPAEQVQQDSGGYKMPANWVNMVQRTQTSHLPDPADPALVDQDITVFFTGMKFGGVSFALLEDRKFKSAPRALMPEAKIRNGWPQNPKWDAAKSGDVAGAELLGPRQEKFLEAWARDWEGVSMKCAVSATIFNNLCTLPQEATSDNVTQKLPVLRNTSYAANEKLTMDHDSNGWPQTPRNRAVKILRSCLAVHLAGDQHLGSTIQYGTDDFNDGSFALCSPAISNIFPRRWFPPLEGGNKEIVKSVPVTPRHIGEYLDGFGNKMTVHAVANPYLYGQAPYALHNRAPGFGFVVFDKAKREATLTNWPRWADLTKPGAKPYQGWPITIRDEDNGLNHAKHFIETKTAVDGVVEVIDEATGKAVYTWRTPGPRTKFWVWKPGVYTIRSGTRSQKGLRAR
jgi:alkaline phosphatase D